MNRILYIYAIMNSTTFIFIAVGVLLGLILTYFRRSSKRSSTHRIPDRSFPREWRKLLEEHIVFYNKLNRADKQEFENRVHIFLLNVRIVGVDTEVTHLDRIMVASSAIIPILRFEKWHYSHLSEVQIHSDEFPIPKSGKMAKGLVGWGAMEGKMMLSRKAMVEGYSDQNDQVNVALHEFIHLLDKLDGKIDGVLKNTMRDIDIKPWLHIVKSKMIEIEDGRSSIRDYGATNRAEFLAAAGEFYFESPDKLKSEHPTLYSALESVFNPNQANLHRSRRSYW